jgi:hypothetical protein
METSGSGGMSGARIAKLDPIDRCPMHRARSTSIASLIILEDLVSSRNHDFVAFMNGSWLTYLG